MDSEQTNAQVATMTLFTENQGSPCNISIRDQTYDRVGAVSRLKPRIRLGCKVSPVEPSTLRTSLTDHAIAEQFQSPLQLGKNLGENNMPKAVIHAQATLQPKPDTPSEARSYGFAVPPRPPALGRKITLKNPPDFQFVKKASPTPKGYFIWAPNESPFSIYYNHRVHYRIRQHALLQRSEEVGGILLGRVYTDPEDGRLWIAITDSLEAKSAIETRASFTFTSATWVEFHQKVEENPNFSGKSFIGWYHTHPDLGVYLSAYDVFVHEYFFDKPWQVALVIDPESREASFFFQLDGKIYKPREPLAVFDIDELAIRKKGRRKPPGEKTDPKILIRDQGENISPLTKTLHTFAILTLACLLLLSTLASKYQLLILCILPMLAGAATLFWVTDNLVIKKKQLIMLLEGCVFFLVFVILIRITYKESASNCIWLIFLYLICLGLIWLKFNPRLVSRFLSSRQKRKLTYRARDSQGVRKKIRSRMADELRVTSDVFSRSEIKLTMIGILLVILILALTQLFSSRADIESRNGLTMPITTLPLTSDAPASIPFDRCSRFQTTSSGIRVFKEPRETGRILAEIPVGYILVVEREQDRKIAENDSWWQIYSQRASMGGWVMVEELKERAECVSER